MAFARTETGPNRRYLRVQDLRRLRHLVFASRRPVEGRLSGRHVSRQRGHSIEFSDYRQYIPGDEIGDVDWKVYGRSDRLYIRLYEHESDMAVSLLVDASASMAYGGLEPVKHGLPFAPSRSPKAPVLRKYDQACHLAAAIAFLTTRQRDRVSFAFARGGMVDYLHPAGSMAHLQRVLGAMEMARPSGRAQMGEAVRTMSSQIPRRGLMVLIGDLLDEDESLLAALKVYQSRGGDAIVFHVLHADELHLPAGANGVLIDSETDEKLRVNLDDIRADYEQRLRAFLDGWASAFRSRGIDYNLVSTGEDYYKALERYLFRRAARA